MYDLSGVNAVITGTSSGFGYSMSRALLHNGATVAMTARPGEKLKNAVAALRAEGLEKVCELPMDVHNEVSVAEAVSWVEREWGRVDLLVNNAGLGKSRVFPDPDVELPFYEIEPEAFRDVVETNFIGYFLVARGFAPLMVRQGKGRIVNVSTSIGTMSAKGQIPYGPSRAAAEAFSNILTKELEESGIMVNVLLPGGAALTGLMPESQREEYLKGNYTRPLLPAEILDDAILFLASPLAEGMTGERIIGKEFGEWLTEKGLSI